MKGLKYNLALFVANILFALNYSVFISVLERESLSVGAIYMLQTVGLLVVASLLRFSFGARSPMRVGDIFLIGAMALLSTFVWSYGSLWGMSITSPIDAATIASVGPSMTLIFAHLMGRRRLTGVRVVGILLSLSGVALLVLSRGRRLTQGDEARGNLILLGAVFVAAINTLLFKPQLERYGLRRVLFVYGVAAFVVSAPIFAHDLLIVDMPWGDVPHLLEIALLLVAGSALPLMLLFEGTEYLSPLHTSLYRYLQPLTTAVVVGMRSQGEFTLVNGVALVVIVVGGVAVAKGVDRAV